MRLAWGAEWMPSFCRMLPHRDCFALGALLMSDVGPAVASLVVSHPERDNVGLVMVKSPAGATVRSLAGDLRLLDGVPAGHKVALTDIPRGHPVVKYGHVIGVTSVDVSAGQHVHSHNLTMSPTGVDGAAVIRSDPDGWTLPPGTPTAGARSHFMGYRRADGRAATRNFIAVLPTVNCSATVARLVSQSAHTAHANVPGIDGVIALSHDLGCGMAEGTLGDDILRRTLRGYATHVNIVGTVVVSLGCEINQPDNIFGDGLAERNLVIQDLGGTAATVTVALRRIAEMVEDISQLQREPIPVSELILGLQCGGSDSYSGLTANPTLGVAADLLVAAGGKVILGETPEIYGAEQILRERSVTPEIADRIDAILRWWREYTISHGATMDNNPSRGNRVGGITTICEKSLGAVLKAGTSPLRDVIGYAQPVRAAGLTFMDTPGYDPVSATGMVAGGANLLAFTTGRGSLFGSRPVPCLKITSTTRLYEQMIGDMDFDAGPALNRDDQLRYGMLLYDRLIDMASGTPSKSEALGFGAEEIAPWRIGAVL
jgi:altronate hydrolase